MDFNMVPTIICKLLKKEIVFNALNVLNARTVRKSLRRRKIFESSVTVEVKITGRSHVIIDVNTINKSKNKSFGDCAFLR